eukprot:Pgem_evm1s14428
MEISKRKKIKRKIKNLKGFQYEVKAYAVLFKQNIEDCAGIQKDLNHFVNNENVN